MELIVFWIDMAHRVVQHGRAMLVKKIEGRAEEKEMRRRVSRGRHAHAMLRERDRVPC